MPIWNTSSTTGRVSTTATAMAGANSSIPQSVLEFREQHERAVQMLSERYGKGAATYGDQRGKATGATKGRGSKKTHAIQDAQRSDLAGKDFLQERNSKKNRNTAWRGSVRSRGSARSRKSRRFHQGHEVAHTWEATAYDVSNANYDSRNAWAGNNAAVSGITRINLEQQTGHHYIGMNPFCSSVKMPSFDTNLPSENLSHVKNLDPNDKKERLHEQIKEDNSSYTIDPVQSSHGPNNLSMVGKSTWSSKSAPYTHKKHGQVLKWINDIPSKAAVGSGPGFLDLPPEIRNQIYNQLIGEEVYKYEIRTLEVLNDRYLEHVEWNDAFALIRKHSKEIPPEEEVEALADYLNQERKREGRASKTIRMPGSVTAWRYLPVQDLSQDDLWRMDRRDRRRAPHWVQQDKKMTWGHIDLTSEELDDRFRLHIRDVAIIELRRTMDAAPTPELRLALLEKAGGSRGPASLGLTCRQLANEFLPLLYSRVELSFSESASTQVFFRSLRPSLQPFAPGAALTSIHLHHFMEVPGSAQWVLLSREWRAAWKQQNEEKEQEWARSCVAVAAGAPNLRTLDVTVDVREPEVVRGHTAYPNLPIFPRLPANMWVEFWEVEAMEFLADWFVPLKPFRALRDLTSVRLTYQPCPRLYSCPWPYRRALDAAFSRLLLVGPEQLRQEYDSGIHDWFLEGCDRATWQRFPVFGPPTKEAAEAQEAREV